MIWVCKKETKIRKLLNYIRTIVPGLISSGQRQDGISVAFWLSNFFVINFIGDPGVKNVLSLN